VGWIQARTPWLPGAGDPFLIPILLLAQDVKIAAELGATVGLDAPLTRLVRDRWALARDRVGYAADNTGAIKAWTDDLKES